MKPILALAVALAIVSVAPAQAGDVPGGNAFFTNKDRTAPHAVGLAGIDQRYPRPLAAAHGFNIPAGAGAPIPVDPFALPRPYALGEAYVGGEVVLDAKGRATNDRRGAAWDGSVRRMNW